NVRDNIRVTKAGPGTQIFSGPNNFTESLTVSGGTLLINNENDSGTGEENIVAVEAGATLGGTGTSLSTNVAFAAGAVISPGTTNAAGTLAFGGDVVLGEGVTYRANYTSNTSPAATVAGALSLPASLTIALTPLEANAELPRVISLFTSPSITGTENVSGWQITGEGGDRYTITVSAGAITAALPPRGTVIMFQ
ncbi:MAG: autotransporter-associated beta strand repeat-containing protein, partial [Kiritimatiellae bacterium]|nr:autotransporter-associated beta strand repeat-containing protein [Kiritimatiellia bacterium]